MLANQGAVDQVAAPTSAEEWTEGYWLCECGCGCSEKLEWRMRSIWSHLGGNLGAMYCPRCREVALTSAADAVCGNATNGWTRCHVCRAPIDWQPAGVEGIASQVGACRCGPAAWWVETDGRGTVWRLYAADLWADASDGTMKPIILSRDEVRELLAAGELVICRGVRADADQARALARYGGPGDRLWVREAFSTRRDGDTVRVRYPADGGHGEPKVVPIATAGRHYAGERYFTLPAKYMPRWASRLELEILEATVTEQGGRRLLTLRARSADTGNPP